MKSIKVWADIFVVTGIISLLSACNSTPEIAIDDDDIAGVVTSSAGVEAGVWVIAETDDLDTRFVRIVVTDDEGRYLLPDLPAANYSVWVRGYGLRRFRESGVDSRKSREPRCNGRT